MNSDRLKPPPAPEKIPGDRRLIFYWLPLALYCGAIFWQSAYPSIQGPEPFSQFDKVQHLAAYGIMAWLFARALTREAPALSPGTIRWTAVAFACLYGLSDEFHQSFVPSRTADVWDWAADTAGAFLWALFFSRKPPKSGM